MIEFMIDGKPIAQKRHRFAKGHVYDPSSKDKKEFRRQCVKHAPIEPIESATSIEVEFCFERPKSHYGTGKNANKLKPSAPEFHTRKPDADNCLKACMDALNGLFWVDDSVIDEVVMRKKWGDKPYTHIVVHEPEDDVYF